jgi:hypothetical protein
LRREQEERTREQMLFSWVCISRKVRRDEAHETGSVLIREMANQKDEASLDSLDFIIKRHTV